MTAVEWLVQEANLLENNGWILPLIQQAKKMEKQQIIDAKDCWFEDERDGEQYYNETFKK
jgi:hypothetical protein